MRRVAWRNLLAHKLRLTLTMAAITLGVAFVAASFVFTDSIQRTFDRIFAEGVADVTVARRSPLAEQGFAPGRPMTVPESLVTDVRQVRGVRFAEGDIFVPGVIVVGRNNEALNTLGAPSFGLGWPERPEVTNIDLVVGRPPRAPGEVVLDSVAAERGDVGPGDTIRLLVPSGSVPVRVVGVARYGETGNLAGATITAFTKEAARAEFLGGRGYTGISVTAAPGIGNQVLAERVERTVGNAFEAKTADEVTAEQVEGITEALGFVNTFLLVIAGIALFVGSFLIFNTFAMLVAQRSRELALLRAVGASRGQVTRAVLFEALVVGVAGSTLGLLVGVGMAYGLQKLFGAFGFEVPTSGFSVAPRTALAAYAVGLVVTVVAAYFPARRAARTPPVAAMRDLSPPERSLRRRALGGLALVAVGLGCFGLSVVADGSAAAAWLGAAAVTVLLGVAVASPLVSRPVVGVLSAPFARRTPGRLGQRNAQRNPRRTAATAAALMIGLSLVSAMGVLSASTKASVDRSLAESLGAADLTVGNAFGQPFSAEVARQIRTSAAVDQIGRQRYLLVRIGGDDEVLAGVNDALLSGPVTVDLLSGRLAALADGRVLVSQTEARDNGLSVGERVRVTATAGVRRLRVGGVFADTQVLTPYVVSLPTLTHRLGGPRTDSFLFLTLDESANPTAAQGRIERLTAEYPIVQVQNREEFVEQQRQTVDTLLYLIYMLLGLAILIAVLGIINTLALSVLERTRELGLLRAVGMMRRQMASMIRVESVVISLFGAALGLLVGLAFGVNLQRVLADDGIDVLAIPFGQLAIFFVLSGLAGVLAALWPARRAGRIDVLSAITAE